MYTHIEREEASSTGKESETGKEGNQYTEGEKEESASEPQRHFW